MPPAESDAIAVSFDGKKCIHARRCVLALPAVFRPGTKGGWIFPDEAKAEEIARTIDSCPSGALTYRRKDDGMSEQMAQVNTAQIWEDGPIQMHGDIQIAGQEPRKRATLCRCGLSKNKPYCDNSHIEGGFTATANIPTREGDTVPDLRGGPVEITPQKDGPLKVSGSLEIIAGSGRRAATGTKFFLCRCGHSKNKPYCDGSHKEAGFTAE